MIFEIIAEYVVSSLIDKHRDKLPDRMVKLTTADNSLDALLEKKILPKSLDALNADYPELQRDEDLTEQVIAPAIAHVIYQTMFSGKLSDEEAIQSVFERLLAYDLSPDQQHRLRNLLDDFSEHLRRELAQYQSPGDALIMQALNHFRSEMITHFNSLETMQTSISASALPKTSEKEVGIQTYLALLEEHLQEKMGIGQYVEVSGTVDEAKMPFGIDEFGYSEIVTKQNEVKRSEIGSIRDVVNKYRILVLCGDAGSSKTTTIRHLALEALYTARDNIQAPIPLLVYLPRWADSFDFEQFITQELTSMGFPESVNPIQLIRSGKAIVFLDGLNEMGHSTTKNKKQLTSFIIQNRHYLLKMIVTCRTDDYTTLRISDDESGWEIPTVEINPLSNHQIINFVKSYLIDQADEFISMIFSSTNDSQDLFHSLAKNPYMLSALMLIYGMNELEYLPKNQAEVIQNLTRALARRENIRKSTGWQQFEEQYLHITNSLSQFAFSMIRDDLGSQITPTVTNQYMNELDVKAATSASFLIHEQGFVGFYHQRMRDYFAALYLTQQTLMSVVEPLRCVQEISHWGRTPSKWEQVIVDWCSLNSEIIDTVLASISELDPYLASIIISSNESISNQTISSVVANLEKFYNRHKHQFPYDFIVISALGNIDSESSASFLYYDLLDSKIVHKPQNVNRAMFWMGLPPVGMEVSEQALKSFKNIPISASRIILRELVSNKQAEQEKAVQILRKANISIREEDLQELFKQHHSPEKLARLVQVLIILKSSWAADIIKKLLSHQSQLVQVNAIEAYSLLENQDAKELFKLLNSPKAEVKYAAANALMKLKRIEVRGFILNLIKSNEDIPSDFIVKIIKYCTFIQIKDIFPILEDNLNGNDLNIRIAVIESISQFGNPNLIDKLLNLKHEDEPIILQLAIDTFRTHKYVKALGWLLGIVSTYPLPFLPSYPESEQIETFLGFEALEAFYEIVETIKREQVSLQEQIVLQGKSQLVAYLKNTQPVDIEGTKISDLATLALSLLDK